MPTYEYACRAPCGSPDRDKKLSGFAAQKPNIAMAPAARGTCGHRGAPGGCALN